MVGLLVAASLGGSWLMVPKKGELIERLFKDKQYARVVSVLQDELHGMRFSDISGLQDLDTAQLTALSRLLNLTPREQLRSVFLSRNAPKYDAYVHNIVMAAIRFVDVLPPAEVHDLILPAIHRVPERLRVGLLSSMAQSAQAVSRPDMAATALTLACQCADSDWNLAQRMVQSYRWSGDPKRANTELRMWIESHRRKLTGGDLDKADELHYQLALESGQPGEAFEVCLQQMQKVPLEEHLPATLMENAYRTALQSGKTTALLPWLSRYVSAMPQASLSMREVQNAPVDDNALAEYKRWAKILAQWSDWNSRFNDAFDHHLRLAVLGDTQSRDRCVEIYDYLGRTEECCEMLALLGEVKERPQYLLLYARQLAELGRDEEAEVCYVKWIAQNPKDRRARYDFACLLEDKGDEAASRKALEVMLQDFPDDVPAKIRLALACVRDGDLNPALDLYSQIPDKAHTFDTLENYLMTAESLDDAAARYRALTLTLAITQEPDISLYLDLADAANELSADAGAGLAILNDAVRHVPGSARLRIALAGAHLKSGRPDEALAVLIPHVPRENFELVQTILDMAESIGDARPVLDYLGSDVGRRFPLSEANRLQLAVLHTTAGETEIAERLFASVPERKETLRMLAEARQHAGNAPEGARLMSRYIDSNPKATAHDWIFLGELLEESGQPADAQRAFDHSLVLLTSDLPDTAAN